MGFGISVNGSHAAEHNAKVMAAVESFMDELEKIDDVHANLNGFVDGAAGREHFQRSLPRDKENQAKLRKEQEAQAKFEANEAQKEAKQMQADEKAADEPAAKAKAPRARTPKQKAADKKADAKAAREEKAADKAEAKAEKEAAAEDAKE